VNTTTPFLGKYLTTDHAAVRDTAMLAVLLDAYIIEKFMARCSNTVIILTL
jgi:hypothetical protein